jgi:hypothetical protein
LGSAEYIWYNEANLIWLDFLSTEKYNYFLFPQIMSIRHSDFQLTCEINAGVFHNNNNKIEKFYIGWIDDESEIKNFRPLFEVPHEDYNWSGGGFRINFSTLKEISLGKNFSLREVLIKLYE